MTAYDDTTLAVIGLLTLGAATVDELLAKGGVARSRRAVIVKSLAKLIDDERVVVLPGRGSGQVRYALITRPW